MDLHRLKIIFLKTFGLINQQLIVNECFS